MLAPVLASCVIEVNTEPRPPPLTEEERWVEAFNTRAILLDARHTFFATEPRMMHGSRHRLFWTDRERTIHGYAPALEQRVDYTFQVVDHVTRPYLALDGMLLAANRTSGDWTLAAYRDDQPSALVDSLEWPAYSDRELAPFLSPMAVDGDSVYLLDAHLALHRWRPGKDAPTRLLALADLGIELQEMPSFSVRGQDLLVATNTLAFIDEQAGPQGVWHARLDGGPTGIVAHDAVATCFFPGGLVLNNLVNAGAALYTISDRRIHDLNELVLEGGVDLGGGVTLTKDRLLVPDFPVHLVFCDAHGITFVNDAGVFAFDIETGRSTPLHLQPQKVQEEPRPLFSYNATVRVGPSTFIAMSSCSGGDCAPPAIYESRP